MQRLDLEQKALIRSSFDAIADNLEAVVAEFYRLLFETAPQARAFFSDNLSSQLEKMLRSLEFLIEVLDRPDALQDYAKELGTIHAKLGMTSAHFEIFVPVFTAAVRAFSPEWSPQQETAWQLFLEDVSALMGFAINT